MTVDLDPELRRVQVIRANMIRGEAHDLFTRYRALIAQAEAIERTWQIPPPCIICGRRRCSH